ncbi:AAA family ATPase [Legionella tunisiensis]|uniref:AAA family ATPase n=1 Tax=Legionella tunisiensis TaxID=1034944 RepID=UPI0002E46FD8|nr:AAA family ATPase [Legionella tunisiensis]
MRIAVSGTHFMGKSTLIEDFIKLYPQYSCEIEPYYKLSEVKSMELALEPSLDSLMEQLDYSIEQLNKRADESNIIFDRCPVDFIAYAMCEAEQEAMDLNDSEMSERFSDVKEALNHLDLIIFLPIIKEHLLEYTEENPAYRKKADSCFKKYIVTMYTISFLAMDDPELLKFGVNVWPE